MAGREARCPLCGAKMDAAQLLDACEEIIDDTRGVLACRCPHCQGYLEVMPAAGRIDIGYLINQRFDVVLSLPCDGLAVANREGGSELTAPGRIWQFT